MRMGLYLFHTFMETPIIISLLCAALLFSSYIRNRKRWIIKSAWLLLAAALFFYLWKIGYIREYEPTRTLAGNCIIDHVNGRAIRTMCG